MAFRRDGPSARQTLNATAARGIAAAAALLAAGVALGAAGCGQGGARCAGGIGPDGRLTLAAGPVCLRDVSVRVRVAGAWQDQGVTAVLDRRGDATLVTLEGPAGAEAFELEVPDLGIDADRMLQEGYQSWSFTGTVRIPAQVPLDDDGAPAVRAAATGDVFDEAAGVSYGAAALGDGQGGPVLVVGATSSRQATTGIAATRGPDRRTSLTVVYGAAREPLPVTGGAVTAAPIAFVGMPHGHAEDGLEELRNFIAARLPPDQHVRPPARPPAGWYSWNQRFSDIDQSYILDHLALVEDELAPHGMPLVEIDDGWEQAWGQWTSNDAFPDGIDAVVGSIHQAGATAGVWMAPFLIDTDSDVGQAIDHALLVKDADGQPLTHTYPGAGRTFYVLDGENPAAMQAVADVVAALSAAGVRYFKFDFLYAGALPGTRSQPVTGNQALLAGLAQLRRAAGPDAVINACGAPIYTVLGAADSLRIGPDSAYQGVPLAVPQLTSPARSYAGRAHLFPLIWPDADNVQVRAPLSDDLARAWTVTGALAGAAYSLGDDLTQLPADRLALALDPVVLDIAGGARPARPLDLLATAADGVTASPAIESYTNPTRIEAPPPTRFEAVGKSGTTYEITFAWDDPQSVSVSPVAGPAQALARPGSVATPSAQSARRRQ